MEIVKSVILGIVQGLTEFLPISSSGHLVLAADLINFQEEGAAFEVFVHLGTLLSVLIAFRTDIAQMIIAPFRLVKGSEHDRETQEYARWILYVIIGTIPAAIIGLLFKEQIEALFSSTPLVIAMLVITGTILFLSSTISGGQDPVSPLKSLVIGCAQAFAILPGISRSGSTIVTGMALGVEREKAAKFSFILSIPAILGAFILKLNDLMAQQIEPAQVLNLLFGTVTAFVSGYVAIIWLMKLIKQGKLDRFSYYCFALAAVAFVWYIL